MRSLGKVLVGVAVVLTSAAFNCGGSDPDPKTDAPDGGGETCTGSPCDGGPDGGPEPEPLCLDVATCPGRVSIIHAWGITNAAPQLWGSGYAPPTNGHCSWDASMSCRAVVESGVTGPGPDGPCCATTPNGPNCSGQFSGMWHAWVRDWWREGWLPSIGVSESDVRKYYVIYNRNGFWGGPHHDEDCEAILQLQQALVGAYRQCDTHVVVTTHSNGGVTFLWAWRDFIEKALEGASGGTFDQDRAATCAAKGRLLGDGTPPGLVVNAHLMQAAVGNGDNLGESASDFFPLFPYATVGKRYWEPSTAGGTRRATLGVRFYYNHEDVMTYDYDGVSTVGRNEVLHWLDGTVDGTGEGTAGFWQARTGQPPYVAVHACGHTSGHSAAMGANNDICGDLIIRNPAGSVVLETGCSDECPQMQSWYNSAQGPGFCLNPCHRNCFGPTAMTAIQIRPPAVYADKFPFSYGNRNLRAMSTGAGSQDGWLANDRRLDWRELYDRQVEWCGQTNLGDGQEPYVMGYGPKFGPLIDGRNDGSGEVTF